MKARSTIAALLLPALLSPAWGAEGGRSAPAGKGGAPAERKPVPKGAPGKGAATPRKPASSAVEEARTLPIEITADRLQADAGKSSVAFEGNVVAVQGDVTLRSDRLLAEYSKRDEAIEKVTAEGNVRVVQSSREASGAMAVFYNLEQRIVLTGDVSLAEGENRLRGESVTILLRENRSVVTGGEGGGRVKAVLFPKAIPGLQENLPR